MALIHNGKPVPEEELSRHYHKLCFPNPNERFIVVYHSKGSYRCVDGLMSATPVHLMQQLRGINVEFVEENYNFKYDYNYFLNFKDAVVWVVDFTFTAPGDMQLLCKLAKEVVLIDHHESALAIINTLVEERIPNFTSYYDIEECGASLFWKLLTYTEDLLQEPGIKLLMQMVRDADIWPVEKHPKSMALRAAFRSEELTRQFFGDFVLKYRENVDGLLAYAESGQVIENYLDRTAKDGVRTATVVRVNGVLGAAQNTTAAINETGSQMAAVRGTFGLMWNINKFGEVKCNFRSSKEHGNFNVREMAERFGGGGHHNAAGCTFKNYTEFLKHVEFIYST